LSSLPVTTRRIGFISSGMGFLDRSKLRRYSVGGPDIKEKNMRRIGLLRAMGGAAKIAALGASLSLLPAGLAQAQNFPTRPVKIIVGPSPDVFSRIIAEHL